MDWGGTWRRAAAALDIMIWAWDSLMLYVCAVWLIPMATAAIIGLLLFGDVPLRRGLAGDQEMYFAVMLAGALVWLGVAGYARFAGTPKAAMIQAWIERMFWRVVYTASALMVIFALVRWAV